MADSAALAIRDRLDGRSSKPKSKRQQAAADEAILKEARDRWMRCDEAEDEQRRSILAAKKFRVGDQWPEAIKIQRQGSQGIAGVAAQPARPCLTIDRVSQPVRQVSNAIKNANLGFDVLPNGFGADSETAEIFKGYLRYVQVNAREESPIEWAADGAAEGGIGWMRLRCDYVDQAPDQPDESVFYQQLCLDRITNNLSVYCDPASKKPTRRDALFMFVTEDMSKDEYKRQFGKSDDDVKGIEDFTSTGDMAKWCNKDEVRIAEYWRVVFKDEKWIRTAQGVTRVDAFPPDVPVNDRRTVRRPVVEGYKINAIEILERWSWLGTRIPLFPIQGEELNVDGQIVLRGMIQEAMDAQRMLNYTYSGAIEIFALGPKSPFIVEEQQLGDYTKIWETANTYNYAYLPYKASPNAPPPQRQVSEAPIQAAVELARFSEESVQAATSYYDSGLGSNDNRIQSGRAKQSEIQQSEQGNSHYFKNVELAVIAMAAEMVFIAPQITQPGQLLHILGRDDEVEQVVLGQAYTQDPKTKRAMPAMNSQGQPMTPDDLEFQKGVHKFYDWRQGRYAVTVAMGKSTATKREEGAAALGELIPHLPPEMAMVLTPEYIENLSIPNAHKMAEMARKTLPPQLQPDTADGQNPQVQQLQQQVQALQQQIQSKAAEKQAEAQAKGQVDLQKTMLSEQAQTQRSTQTDQVSLQKAEIAAAASMSAAQAKVDAENFRSYVDALETRLAKSLDLHMGAISDHLAKLHEASTQGRDHAHAANMAVLEHSHALEQGAQAAQAAQQQAVTQASLQPEPTQGAE